MLRNFYDRLNSLPPANKVWGKVIFLHLFLILFTGVCGGGCGVGYPSIHCRWYPSMPCGGVSQHALQLVSQHALQQGVCYPSMPCSRRGCLLPGGLLQGGLLLLWAVRILLECILVAFKFWAWNEPRK